MGAPGKSTGLFLDDILARMELALADVNFSAAVAARAALDLEVSSCLSKKALKPSGIDLGEHGGVSGMSPP